MKVVGIGRPDNTGTFSDCERGPKYRYQTGQHRTVKAVHVIGIRQDNTGHSFSSSPSAQGTPHLPLYPPLKVYSSNPAIQRQSQPQTTITSYARQTPSTVMPCSLERRDSTDSATERRSHGRENLSGRCVSVDVLLCSDLW